MLLTEFKAGLNAYLATTDPAQVPYRSLTDIIAFNRGEPRELAVFDQDIFEMAEATNGLDDPAYREALATSRRLAREEGIDRLMAEHRVTVLIAPTGGPAWPTDLVNGDHFGGSASQMAAVAGYPHLTVPMGFVGPLPVGISFIGGRWEDARVLSYGYAFEQATQALRPPRFLTTVGQDVAYEEAVEGVSGN